VEQEGYDLLGKQQSMLENGYEKIENELKTGLKDVANRAKNAQEYNK
jgi:hypothetical protein